MKMNRLNIVFSLLALIMLGFSACQPEEYSMGDIISKDDLRFSITQNTDDPNMVILESQTPGVTPMWVTPMGRSTSVKDTVKIPFAGEYDFVYGVQSDGGFVRADTFKLEITTNNLMYVDDPLWAKLTGGVGEEKTWLLDLDADGVSKYFDGPMYFYGTDDSWETVTEGKEVDGDSWNWKPAWEGNQWIMPAGDYGSMTFSLKGNATLTVDHKMLGRQEEGTFFLDAGAKTMTTTDAYILHDEGREDVVSSWGNIKVMSLTEDAMQLAVLRDQSDEGEALLVYNFISKEYAENWTPEETGDPEINLDLGNVTNEELLSVSNSKTWSLSSENPFDWATLEGDLMNGWTSPAEYPDWSGYGPSFSDVVASNQITFNEDGTVSTVDSDGNESVGTFSIDEENVITFEQITPTFSLGSAMEATTTEDNQWKIVKIEKTGDTVTDMWLGKRDPEKPEYMVFHFVLGGGNTVDPIEQARKNIVKALTGGSSRTFKVDDTWPVDWGDENYEGGWTDEHDFENDFESESWLWTQETKNSLQDPRLEFSVDADGNVTCTKTQNGETTTSPVSIDGENMEITIDQMGLIEFGEPATFLPVGGPTWKICRNELSVVETEGIWLGTLQEKDDGTMESVMFHYIIEQ